MNDGLLIIPVRPGQVCPQSLRSVWTNLTRTCPHLVWTSPMRCSRASPPRGSPPGLLKINFPNSKTAQAPTN